MATAEPTKSERLEVRVSPRTKELIVRACNVAGVSVSGFATTVLVREATELLRSYTQLLQYGEPDTLALLEALENPPEPADRLRRAWREGNNG